MTWCARPRRHVLLFLLGTVLILAVHARDGSWQIDQRVDWREGALLIGVTAPVPTSGPNLPAAEHTVRREIDREVARLFHDAAQRLRLNSAALMIDRVIDDSRLSAALLAAVQTPQIVSVRRTTDMRSVEVQYRLELFPDIAATVVRHTSAQPLPRVAGWVPTRRYTGVVIFAQGELPVYGEQAVAELRPALLPAIYDQRLRRVVSHEMLEGSNARGGSLVRYVSDLNDPLVHEIAGPDPVRINAAAVFGRQRSDIIIPESAAQRLLYGHQNSAVLQGARIVVVMSASRVAESLGPDR
ncbi:MAG: hypothetical protein EA384_02495 [Spirochaetaceae bacterium]|nr:MAG: hypothetical protein EA384_02495 [Spirochaetaceae bacterium]